MPKNTFAVIHIGSEHISMQIAEYTSLNNMQIKEHCVHQIILGEETFKTGKISFEKVSKICELLKGYRRLLREYDVTDYRLIATTAIREAENQKYIIDQIMIKTGFDVEVIDIPQEIFYKYISLYRKISNNGLLTDNRAILFVDISSGGLGFTLYQEGFLLYQQNISIGVLRIKESFGKSQRESSRFFDALSEYIYIALQPVQTEMAPYNIKRLVLSSAESKLILNMLGKELSSLNSISLNEFHKLYDKVKTLNLPQIMTSFGLSETTAEMVLPTIVLYNQVLSLTNAEEIFIPNDQVIDGIIAHHLAKKTNDPVKTVIEEQIISLARAIGRRYQYDPLHAQAVEKWCLIFFDKLTGIHGLKARDRLILKASAILHDIGKYVCLRNHYSYSYRLIQSSDMLGFSKKEKEIIANVAYYHSFDTPSDSHPNYAKLSTKQKVTVAKLAAIIRLANSLDQSSKQKISSLHLTFRESENEIIVKVNTNYDLSLEEWSFEKKTYFFEAVFGIKIRLTIQAG